MWCFLSFWVIVVVQHVIIIILDSMVNRGLGGGGGGGGTKLGTTGLLKFTRKKNEKRFGMVTLQY